MSEKAFFTRSVARSASGSLTAVEKPTAPSRSAASSISAGPGPTRASAAPPNAGAMSRMTLKPNELRANAFTMFCRGTMLEMMVILVGSSMTNARPIIRMYANMCQVCSNPNMTTTLNAAVATHW